MRGRVKDDTFISSVHKRQTLGDTKVQMNRIVIQRSPVSEDSGAVTEGVTGYIILLKHSPISLVPKPLNSGVYRYLHN